MTSMDVTTAIIHTVPIRLRKEYKIDLKKSHSRSGKLNIKSSEWMCPKIIHVWRYGGNILNATPQTNKEDKTRIENENKIEC